MNLDFSEKNLQGRNFQGQDLAGANFSYADIRGANFTNANLKGANFSHAQAGLQRSWAFFLVFVSCLVAGLAGFFWAFNGYLVSQIFNGSSLHNQISGWTALIAIISFAAIINRYGIEAKTLMKAISIAGVIAGALTLVGAFASSVAIGFAVAGAVAFAIAGGFGIAVEFAVAFVGTFAIAGANSFLFAGVFAGLFATAGTLFSLDMARKAMKGSQKYSLIRHLAIVFAAMGGTSFRSADLTDADFTAAMLKSTDFRNAILTNTIWHNAKMLDHILPGSTYLQNKQVRKLVVTGQGQEKNFDGQNLRGINVQKANLANASLIGTDLREANLQTAYLSGAKLKQTQLGGADLTGATLTGAYIEDWQISRETNLQKVKCEYVFTRLPTLDEPEPFRKPDNIQETFAQGEFADFIQPIFNTLDLYHNQKINPSAIAIALINLAANHPEAELEIVALEKRGKNTFLLKVKTANNINKSQLSAEYFTDYNHLKTLQPSQQLSIIEKDSQIQSLAKVLRTIIQQSKFYPQEDTRVANMNSINIQSSNNAANISS
ncbi:pentapeptide repeat-containing protein [Nostoc sp. FACHB-110]|uniref:pentapeptide repeat-containing protein n=1 Tax=Nostoc sp. FACHB-110 TaxID=2692834 RepID=UPI001683A659|nr:pentapeptide repeat-containing protein [Nostoc sp. FACHB-110]MBD2438182.1 pentapeptide repeat-containing protein [Nostoc sp. FACHB-110]